MNSNKSGSVSPDSHDSNLMQALADLGDRHQSAVRILSAITRLSGVPIAAADQSQASQEILAIIVKEIPEVSSCSLLLFDPKDQLLKLAAAQGKSDLLEADDPPYNRKLAFKPGQGVAGYVFDNNEPLFWDRDGPAAHMLITDENMITPTSLACLPLNSFGQKYGVLNISFLSSQPFEHIRKRGLILLGQVAANIVQTLKLKNDVDHHVTELKEKIGQIEKEVAEHKRTQQELKRKDQRIRTFFKVAPVGIAIANPRGRFLETNGALCQMLGYTPWELTQKRFVDIAHPDEREDIIELGKEIARGKTDFYQTETRYQTKDGQPINVIVRATAIRDKSGEVEYWIRIIEDITERKRSEEKIAFQAYHDALTGLPNRYLFNDRLTVAIAQARRNSQTLGLLFLDLDNFKNINDSLGHTTGDKLLKEVAIRLMSYVREEDTVSRLGGDEFIILLQGIEEPDYAVYVAERIQESLAAPFRLDGHDLFISASMGITFFPHDGGTFETLVSNADIAMYRAKEEGRNKYKLFTPAMNTRVVKRLAMEGSLRKAVSDEQFVLYYQPKVDLGSGRLTGLEALVRWQRPGAGLALPDEFIPLAEDMGLIVPLGEQVVRAACRDIKTWWEMGLGSVQVAVNISPRQFQAKNLVEMIDTALRSSGLKPQCLDLEVTENVVMHNVEEAIAILNQLSDLGVSLSMDDFGRGYSSLYYLKRFPMQTLKIDRSFVSDITSDPNAASIVNTIISMSRSLNLKVVAEGVETWEQMTFLRERSCDQMQGYLCCRPVPADQVPALLSREVLLYG